MTNCTLIGMNAGLHLTDEENVVIIGDNIVSLDKSQKNVLFIGDKVAIGETVFGIEINLKMVIESYNHWRQNKDKKDE